MNAKPKTRTVDRTYSKNFLKRAKECLDAADVASKKENWNASAINSIYCAISAGDALCVYFMGKRHSGENHNDAAKLLHSLDGVCENIKPHVNRYVRLLRMKNMAEYEERLIYKSEAEKMLRHAEIFYHFTELHIMVEG